MGHIIHKALGVVLCLLISASLLQAKVIYVKHNASGNNNGSSWANAYTSLTSALSASASGDELWVAAGTYKPSTNGTRTVSFELKSGIKVYGGFAGTESSRSQRDWTLNQTILSGDIGTVSTRTDNSYHVVKANSMGSNTVFDGFIVRDGYANGSFSSERKGAGILMDGGDAAIRNCQFIRNYALVTGGGIFMATTLTSPIKLTQCDFIDNYAGQGAGIYLDQGIISEISNCKFIDNNSSIGAGFSAGSQGSIKLIRSCQFNENYASQGGGFWIDSDTTEIQSCSFFKNTGANGGGFYTNKASLTVNSCTFDSNQVTQAGGAFFQQSGKLLGIEASSFKGNSSTSYGGALYSYEVDGVIDSCQFIGNSSASNSGGALRFLVTNLTILRSRFEKNQATYGGGIFYYRGNLSINECLFDSNSASDYGGAIYGDAPSGPPSLLKEVKGCSFIQNTSGKGGAAIYAHVDSSYLEASTFQGNLSDGKFGAVYLDGDATVIKSCLFAKNVSDHITNSDGGALTVSGDGTEVRNCRFFNNSLSGIGTKRGGAISITSGSNTVIDGCIFNGNSIPSTSSCYGGAINDDQGPINIINSCFSGNSGFYGGAIHTKTCNAQNSTFSNNAGSGYKVYITTSSGDTTLMKNCISWGHGSGNLVIYGTKKVENSIIENGYNGTNVGRSNPLFLDADGIDNIPGTIDDDLRLRSISPAIDAGSTANAPLKDITGFMRNLVPDIGAYEYGATSTMPPSTIDTSGHNNGGNGNGNGNGNGGGGTTDSTVSGSLPDTLYACTQDTFCIPVYIPSTIQHVIGWDISLEFDSGLVVPTGSVSLSGTNMINDAYVSSMQSTLPGKPLLQLSLFLNGQGPTGTCWNGSGELLCIEFAKKAGATGINAGFKIKQLLASYITRTARMQGDSSTIALIQGSDVFESQLSHWRNDTLIRYDTARASRFLPTVISGFDQQGNTSGGTVKPNLQGRFSHPLSNGTRIRIRRDIKGSLADTVATDVMDVINGQDAMLMKKVLLYDTVGFIPNVYQLIAMDVNRDGFISAGDLSQLNERTVRKIREFKQSGNYQDDGTSNSTVSLDWVFIDSSTAHHSASYKISESYPYMDGKGGYHQHQVPVPSEFLSLPVMGSGSCPKVFPERYIGVLIGDVDGNWENDTIDKSLFSVQPDQVQLALEEAELDEESCTIKIPIKMGAYNAEIRNMDLKLSFDPESLELDTLENAFNGEVAMVENDWQDNQLYLTSYLQDTRSQFTYPNGKTVAYVSFKMLQTPIDPESLRFSKVYLNGTPGLGEVTGRQSCSNLDNGTTGIDEPRNASEELSLYPNPTTGILHLNGLGEAGSLIKVIDSQGRLVHNKSLSSGVQKLDLSMLPSGLYYLKVFQNGNSQSLRFIKR